MRISRIIKYLENLKIKHGDIMCTVDSDVEYPYPYITAKVYRTRKKKRILTKVQITFKGVVDNDY